MQLDSPKVKSHLCPFICVIVTNSFAGLSLILFQTESSGDQIQDEAGKVLTHWGTD